jgi:hypothetical protein
MPKRTSFLALVIATVLGVQSGWGWGNATHVYFARELGPRRGLVNANDMYGALLPDCFNLMFDANGTFLYGRTHIKP